VRRELIRQHGGRPWSKPGLWTRGAISFTYTSAGVTK
jgi:hypothetical protein